MGFNKRHLLWQTCKFTSCRSNATMKFFRNYWLVYSKEELSELILFSISCCKIYPAVTQCRWFTTRCKSLTSWTGALLSENWEQHILKMLSMESKQPTQHSSSFDLTHSWVGFFKDCLSDDDDDLTNERAWFGILTNCTSPLREKNV